MRTLTRVLAICGIAVCCAAGSLCAQAVPAQEFKLHAGSFTAEEGGFVIAATGTGTLASLKEYEPGQYLLTGEYKTQNMEPLARFATDVLSADGKTPLSAYEFTSATPEWAPLVLYANVPARGKALLRFGNWQRCSGTESKVHLRNLQIKPQEWTDGMNLLASGDMDKGAPGFLPPNWYWKAGRSKKLVAGAGYSLAKDTTTGKSVIQLVIPVGEEEVMLNGRSFNMPQSGRLELSFSAKADKPCKLIPRIVQSWSAQYTLTTCNIGSDWKAYTVKYNIVPDPNRKFFFIRFDLPGGQEAKLDIADVKLIYHAPAGAATKPVTAPAK